MRDYATKPAKQSKRHLKMAFFIILLGLIATATFHLLSNHKKISAKKIVEKPTKKIASAVQTKKPIQQAQHMRYDFYHMLSKQ